MSPHPSTTTIAAIASPPGGGLRGIIRLSGPRAGEIVRSIWAGGSPLDLARRSARLGRFRDRRGEQPLLLLWMPGPRSFTREDVAEFHLPGAPPLLAAALERLLDLGAVPAAPGEFTRRAFLSGRIDLTRAVGVLALVAARNESERRAGRALLAGGLADRVGLLRERLEDLRALAEASLDFDERDTGHVPEREIEDLALSARAALTEALDWEVARARAAGEPRVVLAGAENAGKSALFNRLMGAEAAIVSPLPGTTRDVLSRVMEIDGHACRLIDTAGVEGPDASGAVVQAARRAARTACESADLLVWVVDASAAGVVRDPPQGACALLVWNKIDLPGVVPAPPPALAGRLPWVATSALTGAGLSDLRAAIARELGPAAPGEGAGLSRELSLRHRGALEKASRALAEGLAVWRGRAPLELLAEHLRRATEALDEITGATTPEDLLDRIFARFCLGK